jgi:hypothetical protein
MATRAASLSFHCLRGGARQLCGVRRDAYRKNTAGCQFDLMPSVHAPQSMANSMLRR